MAVTFTPNELLELFGNIGSVGNSDCILLHQAASNTTKKITAELLRAYLNKGFSISVSEQGYLVIGGQETETKMVGVDIRLSLNGLEISRDGGNTYTKLINFTEILDEAIVYCTEQQYETWAANEQLDENKVYMTYEEE